MGRKGLHVGKVEVWEKAVAITLAIISTGALLVFYHDTPLLDGSCFENNSMVVYKGGSNKIQFRKRWLKHVFAHPQLPSAVGEATCARLFPTVYPNVHQCQKGFEDTDAEVIRRKIGIVSV